MINEASEVNLYRQSIPEKWDNLSKVLEIRDISPRQDLQLVIFKVEILSLLPETK